MKLSQSLVIDAGHGGKDSGAVSPFGLMEKNVTLQVALLMESILAPIMPVHLTRRDDRFIELSERAAIANRLNAAFFLSIHCNAGPVGQGKGFEVFTTPGFTGADPFAIDLFHSYADEFPDFAKRMDLSDGDEDKEAKFTVLTRTRMPAALFELEFIHTEAGHRLFSEPANLLRMARALSRGVLLHCQPKCAA